MARKGAAATADAGEPRRSSRIKDQAKPDPPPKKAPAKPRSRKPKPTGEEGDESNKEKPKSAAHGKKRTATEKEAEYAQPATPVIPALAPIDVGDSLPSYILKNEQGEDVDLAKLTEGQGAILFSIPKADTPGCTTQACGFRDIYPSFTEHNFAVYCLSHDKSEAQKKWQLKKELPYPLLSDPDRVLISALGAKDAGSGRTKRGHFIFAKGGKLVEKKLPVSPGESPNLALEFVKSLNAKSVL
ncbi:AhpC-TSA-domain-containing protein [Russula earlei]|uniref:AhpC-TSA-domain-containing protein n=1 Tax=Russula earlei TaxID=71964 RepID=A0ACC0ULR3_9AGAM|nr:AhpC-TSA-domain-containing protein [Russula earlei]